MTSGFSRRSPDRADPNAPLQRSPPVPANFPVPSTCRSPDSRDKPLRPRRVRFIVLPERFEHPPLREAHAKRDQEHDGEDIGRARHPVGQNERLTRRAHEKGNDGRCSPGAQGAEICFLQLGATKEEGNSESGLDSSRAWSRPPALAIVRSFPTIPSHGPIDRRGRSQRSASAALSLQHP